MTGRMVVLLLLLLGEACAHFNTGSVVMAGRVRVQVWFVDLLLAILPRCRADFE